TARHRLGAHTAMCDTRGDSAETRGAVALVIGRHCPAEIVRGALFPVRTARAICSAALVPLVVEYETHGHFEHACARPARLSEGRRGHGGPRRQPAKRLGAG